jgi:hypothetical protein
MINDWHVTVSLAAAVNGIESQVDDMEGYELEKDEEKNKIYIKNEEKSLNVRVKLFEVQGAEEKELRIVFKKKDGSGINFIKFLKDLKGACRDIVSDPLPAEA